ncbi:Ca2+-binding EF-hand superfamily protein [Streptosporangium becharense]|uniref:Ca2+-binding EF-hand superfamily protein n=1 Tax=Streptosporangium becharense TaxID=1816182 RepID=A0A7W9IJZ8_9ACTN|nr:EF-hand domain-containing protein [Streptosporangium becharense]MBB2911102.1 Ca2+-binding EF-hand superfamily protein [Streptosporangium becharense]MBB5821840.1 Ca2+-binding EF-hand superfamily protein [Streptosporangium becharense]
MSTEPTGERLTELRQEFAAIDSDGDGYITEQELRERFPALPAEAIGSLSRDADSDGDGRFSFEEFVRLVAHD